MESFEVSFGTSTPATRRPLRGHYVQNDLDKFHPIETFPAKHGLNVSEASSVLHLKQAEDLKRKLSGGRQAQRDSCEQGELHSKGEGKSDYTKGNLERNPPCSEKNAKKVSCTRSCEGNLGNRKFRGGDGNAQVSLRNFASEKELTGNSASDCSEHSAKKTLTYELIWVNGINPDVCFLNLCNDQRDDICYVKEENLILYNLATEDFRIRDGHLSSILSLTSDRSGQHLLTMSEEKIIVWDSYVVAPFLTFHPEGSFFTEVLVSPNFQYIWAMTSQHDLYIWNITLIKQNLETSGYAYTLPQAVRGKIVAFVPDPNDEHASILLSEHDVHCLSISSGLEPDLSHSRIPYVAGKAGKFTCIAFQNGTHKMYIGTEYARITEWSSNKEDIRCSQFTKPKNYSAIPYNYKQYYLQQVHLNYNTKHRKNGRNVAITTILCTKEVILVASTHGDITLLSKSLNRLYSIDGFEINFVKQMSFCYTQKEKSNSGSNLASNLNENCADSSSRAFPKSEKTLKHRFNLSKESGLHLEHGSLLNDVIIQSDQGDLICVEFKTGFYYSLKPIRIMVDIQSVCFHPDNRTLYVLYGENVLLRMDFIKDELLNLQKEIEPRNMKEEPRLLCKGLDKEMCKVKKKSETKISCIHCQVLFGITLLFLGLEDGDISILDGVRLTTLHRYSETNMDSPVTSFRFVKDNSMFAATRKNGYISVYDLLELTNLHTIIYYQAHELIIHDVLIHARNTNQIEIISIGSDRMCYYRQITRSGNTYDHSVKILRVEQFAQPMIIRCYPRALFTADYLVTLPGPVEDLYLIVNSEHKYRFYLQSTLKCIKTIQGAPLTSPIKQFHFLPGCNATLISTTHDVIVQSLPLTSYKPYLSYSVIPSSLRFYFVNQTNYVLTLRRKLGSKRSPQTMRKVHDWDNRVTDNTKNRWTNSTPADSVLLWKLNVEEIMSLEKQTFDHPLVPYYDLVPGGYYGNEMGRIKDVFIYFTIQAESHKYLSKDLCMLDSRCLSFHNRVNLCDLPFLLSALDFYPSELDLDNMLAEIEMMGLTELDFGHFLLLYLNHRPKDATFEEVMKALEYFANGGEFYTNVMPSCFTKSEAESETMSSNDLESTSYETSDNSDEIVDRSGRSSGKFDIADKIDEIGNSLKGVTRESQEERSDSTCIDKVTSTDEIPSTRSSSNSSAKIESVQVAAPKLGPSFPPPEFISKVNLADVLANHSEIKLSKEQAARYLEPFYLGRDEINVVDLAAKLAG